VATPRRCRTTIPSRSFSSPEINLQGPIEPPWLEHPTLSGLRDLPDGTSRSDGGLIGSLLKRLLSHSLWFPPAS
jgi:hypothetical protein